MRIGIVNTILFATLLAITSALLQIFFVASTPLWFIILAFICLGSTWAMGNTVPIIAAQMAVESHRASVATGTIVTMFNIGGSIGLALAVVIYNFVTFNSLNHHVTLGTPSFKILENLMTNPAQALQISMDNVTHNLFHVIFIQGFSGVMLLLGLSLSAFLSIFVWKIIKKEKV